MDIYSSILSVYLFLFLEISHHNCGHNKDFLTFQNSRYFTFEYNGIFTSICGSRIRSLIRYREMRWFDHLGQMSPKNGSQTSSSGRFAGSKSRGVGRWAPAATRFITYSHNYLSFFIQAMFAWYRRSVLLDTALRCSFWIPPSCFLHGPVAGQSVSFIFHQHWVSTRLKFESLKPASESFWPGKNASQKCR